MSRVRVRMDAEIVGPDEELPIPTMQPFGYHVPWLLQRRFVLVSRSRGVMCFCADLDIAMPIIRMAVRNAWRANGPLLDFRLYEWNEEHHGWQVFMNTIEIEDLRTILAKASKVARQDAYEVAND